MKNSAPVTRTCLACGLDKPLAAFLQLTGSQGTVYGNICSACRSESAKGKKIPQVQIDEDGAGASGGLKIDNKRRIQIELEQKKAKKKKFTDILEEKKKVEKLSTDELSRTEIKEKAAKDHRQEIAEKKKRTFITERKKIPADIAARVREGTVISEHFHAIEAEKFEAGLKQEEKLLNIDTAQVFLDSQFGELKFQSDPYKRLQALLGESAHFGVMKRLIGKQTQFGAKPENNKETLTDFLEKTEKPSSTRRR